MTTRGNTVHPNVVADRLGIPVATVYERIRNGELKAEKHGNRWMVILPDEPVDDQSASIPLDTAPQSNGSLNRQLAEQDAAIDEIRNRLEALEAELRVFMSVAATEPSQRIEVRVDRPMPAAEPSTIRSPAIHPRLLALSAIIGLTIGGIVIQSSSAQRSDDLTVAFVFACGATTGSIAAWLALEKQHKSTVLNSSERTDRVVRSDETPVI